MNFKYTGKTYRVSLREYRGVTFWILEYLQVSFGFFSFWDEVRNADSFKSSDEALAWVKNRIEKEAEKANQPQAPRVIYFGKLS